MSGETNLEMNVSKLKRKLIGLDVLVKQSEKKGAKIAELEAKNVELQAKANHAEELKTNLEVLKAELKEKVESLTQLGDQFTRTSQKTSQLEADLGKKNSDLIRKEIDLNELRKQIEVVKERNEVLEEQVKNGAGVRKLKEEFESEKWQLLSEASLQKQESAAKDQSLKEMKDICVALQKKLAETQKSKDGDTKKIKELQAKNDENDDVVKKSLQKDKWLKDLQDKLKEANKTIEMLKKGKTQLNTQQDESDLFEGDEEMADDSYGESSGYNPISPLKASPQKLVSPLKASPVKATEAKPEIHRPKQRFQISFLATKKKPKVRRVQFKKLKRVFNNVPTVLGKEPVIHFPAAKENPKTITAEDDLLYEVTFSKEVNIKPSTTPAATAQPEATKVKTPKSTKRKLKKDEQQTQNKKLKASLPESQAAPEMLSPIKSPPQITPTRKPKATSTPSRFDLPSTSTLSSPATSVTSVSVTSSTSKSAKSSPSCSLKSPSTTKKVPPHPAAPAVQLSPAVEKGEVASGPGYISTKMRLLAGQDLNNPFKPSAAVGKLTPAQVEAAKNRMVGRAAPGVASRPSVDGFRQSEPMIKTDKTRVGVEEGKVKLEKPNKASKPKLSIEDEACPSRVRTNPAKMRSLPRGIMAPSVPLVPNNVETKQDHAWSKDQSVPLGDRKEVVKDPETVELTLTVERGGDSKDGLGSKVDISNEKENKPILNNGDSEIVTKGSGVTTQVIRDIDDVDTALFKPPGKATAEKVNPLTVKGSSGAPSKPKVGVGYLDDDLDLSESDADMGQDDNSDNEGEGDVSQSSNSSQIKNDRSLFSESDDDAITDDDRHHNRKKRKHSQTETNNTEENVSFKDSESPGRTAESSTSDTSTLGQSLNKKKVQAKPVNFLEELLQGYRDREEKSKREVKVRREKLEVERKGFAYEAFIECVRKNFKHLLGSQNKESFDRIVEGISIGSITGDEAIICDLVYEYLKNESNQAPSLNQTNPDAPPITRREQRLFTLITELHKKERFSGIIVRLMNLLYHGLFGRDKLYNLKITSACSFTKMYILCARYVDDFERVKQFVLDLLYFKSPRTHLLIGLTIDLWPNIICPSHHPLAQSPFHETVVWLLLNTGPLQRSPEMRVQECRDRLINRYEFSPYSGMKAEDLVKKYVQLAEKNPKNSRVLADLTQCLLLIGRSQDYRWVNNNIVSRLLTSLGRVWKDTSGDQTLLRWVIETIGLISRVYTAEGRENLTQLFDPIVTILKKKDSLTKETEVSCVKALVYLGYHLQYQVAEFFTTWRPAHTLDQDTINSLEDYIGTRGRKHGEITRYVKHVEARKEIIRTRNRRPGKKYTEQSTRVAGKEEVTKTESR